ncbi:uncharacterized protein LOC112560999 isoform X3 [Pomacea canaliculata]|uniref:uncharacterized protein LOC112560999 isoform X3 n=1 Tax=Pomacea canaliculata TaxID=400727 RepID=UPI000D72C7B2|nr:uncharacterized protein LOC112560999 isoform X3 [Pomacea canaliculata]
MIILDDLEDENQSAIELLENAEDLEREGVKNIPKSGYKLSKILRARLNEPLVKLNIKFDPHTAVEYSKALNKIMMKGYESDQENTSPGGQNDSEDEEFESVSQVTGPRQPVWQVPESDGDSSSPNGVRPQQRHEKHRHNRRLASSVPGRFHGIPLNTVTSDVRDFRSRGNQTWAPGHHRGDLGSLTDAAQDLSSEQEVEAEGSSSARSGGWVLPEDSDAASIHDWNQRVKGKKRDPRAY